MNIKQIIKDYFLFNDEEYNTFMKKLTPAQKDYIIINLDKMEKSTNHLQDIKSFLSARGYN